LRIFLAIIVSRNRDLLKNVTERDSMKKNVLLLIVIGILAQSNLYGEGLLKRLRGRKTQMTKVTLGRTSGQKTAGFATSPVTQAVGLPRIVKKRGYGPQGFKTGWQGTYQSTSQRAQKVSGSPKVTLGSSRPAVGKQQVLYTEQGASFQARPQVVSGILAKPRKQTLQRVSEQGVPYHVKARPVKQSISLRTEQGAVYQAPSREVMDLRRPQGVKPQRLPQQMMQPKKSPGFRPAIYQIRQSQLQKLPQQQRRLPMRSMPTTMQPANLPN